MVNIDAIARIDGIDVLFIGHSDLSLSLGCFEEYDNPAIRETENKVLEAAKKFGKTAGMHLKTGMNVDVYIERGFHFMAVGGDTACIRKSFEGLL